MLRSSLIISTYNSPRYLKLCLKSVYAQIILPDEIIVADDGSTESTKEIIEAFKKISTIPLLHVWHEDKGFRKTIILNEAIRQSSFNYIIQIDGDVILEKHFIQDHLNSAEPGFFIRGTRALLNKEKSEELLAKESIEVNPFVSGLENRNNAFRWRLFHFLAVRKSRSSKNVRGSNLSFWKHDFIKINGYNNELIGWGHEDEELAARFINNGILKKIIKLRAVQYHLYHSESTKENEGFHTVELKKVVQNKIMFCSNGYKSIE